MRKRKRDEDEEEEESQYPVAKRRRTSSYNLVDTHIKWDSWKTTTKGPIHKFALMDQVNYALKKDEIPSMYGYEKKNEKRKWIVGNVDSIKELIKSGDNYIHEVILDKPVVLFIDIDNKFEEDDDFESFNNKALVFIDAFKNEYKDYMQQMFDIKIKDEDWLLLDSCKRKNRNNKISYHLIASHRDEDGLKIYYRNIYHVRLMIIKILEFINYNIHKRVGIDMQFYVRKPFRMYQCCKRIDPERILYNPKRSTKEFNNDDYYNSILQLNDKDNDTFVQIDMIDNNDFEDVKKITKTLRLEKKRSKKMVKSVRPSNSNSLPDSINEFSEKLLQSFLEFMIFVDKYDKYDFGFLKKYKNDFEVYRTKYKYEGDNLSVFIDVNGKSKKCLIQDYDHTNNHGRRLILDSTLKEIAVWCAAGKLDGHCHYFKINVDNHAAKRRGLYDHFVNLIERVMTEISRANVK